MPQVEAARAPFQFALSARAGPDCVGHAVRLLTDMNPTLTLLSIDGVGAYDHILRSATLAKLASVPEANAMLPFVLLGSMETATSLESNWAGRCSS